MMRHEVLGEAPVGSRAFNRREILRAGSLSLLGLSLPELLAGRTPAAPVGPEAFGRAKACILLFMWGGPAHQDTWDLKPDAPPEVRGEFKPIASCVPGIQVCEHFPRIALHMDKLCQVRSVAHNNADHTVSTHFLLTGMPPPPTNDLRMQWPHVGSVLSRLGRGRGALPAFVSMRPKLDNDVPRFVEQSQGQFAGWLGPVYDPLTIDGDPSRADYRVGDLAPRADVPPARLDVRRALREQFDKNLVTRSEMVRAHDVNRQRAFDLLAGAAEERGAFRLEEEPPAMRERYGLNPHGQSVLQARRLVERGVPDGQSLPDVGGRPHFVRPGRVIRDLIA